MEFWLPLELFRESQAPCRAVCRPCGFFRMAEGDQFPGVQAGTAGGWPGCGGILDLQREIQTSSCVGPGKPNLPLGLRGKAVGCARARVDFENTVLGDRSQAAKATESGFLLRGIQVRSTDETVNQ